MKDQRPLLLSRVLSAALARATGEKRKALWYQASDWHSLTGKVNVESHHPRVSQQRPPACRPVALVQQEPGMAAARVRQGPSAGHLACRAEKMLRSIVHCLLLHFGLAGVSGPLEVILI